MSVQVGRVVPDPNSKGYQGSVVEPAGRLVAAITQAQHEALQKELDALKVNMDLVKLLCERAERERDTLLARINDGKAIYALLADIGPPSLKAVVAIRITRYLMGNNKQP